jgi:hypothetical protein
MEDADMKADRTKKMRFAFRHINMAKMCTKLAEEFIDTTKLSDDFLCRAEAHMIMARSYISH